MHGCSCEVSPGSEVHTPFHLAPTLKFQYTSSLSLKQLAVLCGTGISERWVMVRAVCASEHGRHATVTTASSQSLPGIPYVLRALFRTWFAMHIKKTCDESNSAFANGLLYAEAVYPAHINPSITAIDLCMFKTRVCMP